MPSRPSTPSESASSSCTRRRSSSSRGKVDEKGLSLIPLRIFLCRGKIKCELGLGKGKKLFDKKDALKERDLDREQARAMRER